MVSFVHQDIDRLAMKQSSHRKRHRQLSDFELKTLYRLGLEWTAQATNLKVSFQNVPARSFLQCVHGTSNVCIFRSIKLALCWPAKTNDCDAELRDWIQQEERRDAKLRDWIRQEERRREIQYECWYNDGCGLSEDDEDEFCYYDYETYEEY